MKKTLFFVCVSCFLLACENSQSKKIEQLNWLVGAWETDANPSQMKETWNTVGDTLMLGKSSFVQNNKTLFTEEMSIRLKKNKLVLSTVISDQNDGKIIEFTEIESTDSKVVFENKKHDFPQKIIYSKKDKNQIQATISGKMEQKKNTIDFNFKRIK